MVFSLSIAPAVLVIVETGLVDKGTVEVFDVLGLVADITGAVVDVTGAVVEEATG
jgi:hypothetical protein